MSLRREFRNRGEYECRNTMVRKVTVLKDRINVWCDSPGVSKQAIVMLPLRADVMSGLFEILDIENLEDAEGRPVRLLRLGSGNDSAIQWDGICHFMKETHLSVFSLWVDHEKPELGPQPLYAKGAEVFKASGVKLPPGLPWRLENQGDKTFKLWDPDSEKCLADNVCWELAEWLEKHAGLAKIEDDIHA